MNTVDSFLLLVKLGDFLRSDNARQLINCSRVLRFFLVHVLIKGCNSVLHVEIVALLWLMIAILIKGA